PPGQPSRGGQGSGQGPLSDPARYTLNEPALRRLVASAPPFFATAPANSPPLIGSVHLHPPLRFAPAFFRAPAKRPRCKLRALFSTAPEPFMSRTSLSRFLIEQTRTHQTPADLRFLIEVVARACKEISHQVSKGALGGVLGSMGTENVQGEVQKKLDVISNEILLEANEWGGHLAGMASEEMDNAYQIPGKYPKGAYLLVFDPLDGSSNIDVNVSVGTIFSVLRCPERNGATG